MAKNHHGPTSPNTGKAQAVELEAEKKAQKRAADKAALKVFEERCKKQAIKREARAERTEELRQLTAKKKAIAKRYV